MKTLLAAALLLAAATASQAMTVDQIAVGMCSGQKNERLCAFKLSGCVDDVFARMSAKGEDYSVTMATYLHCAEEQNLEIKPAKQAHNYFAPVPNALGAIAPQ